MKNRIALICLFVSSFLCAGAQKKTFIIDQKMDHLIDRVSAFQTLLSKDGMFDAAKSDLVFLTNVSIAEEKYQVISADHYLKVTYKKAPSAGAISTDWDLKLEKMAATKTKVTVTLKKIVPDQNLKGNIDVAQTISSGKLEKQLENFLNSNADKL